jgi:hypothetical protein
MLLKSIAVGAGACALVAGAALAGNAAHASAPAAAAGQAQLAAAGQAQLAASDADLTELAANAGMPAEAADGAGGAAVQGRPKLCARVPLAIERTQNLEQRLAADVNTPGSLAYLQHRIDGAQAAHNTQLVTTLTNRMTFRKQLAVFLPQRLTLLQTAQRTVCVPAAGSPATS